MWPKIKLTFAAFIVFSIIKSKGAPAEFSEEMSKDTAENLRDLFHNPPKEDSLANLGDITKDASELIRKYLQTNEDEQDHKEADDYLEKIHPGMVAKMNKDIETMKRLAEESDDDDENEFAEQVKEDMEDVKNSGESAKDEEEA